MSSANARSSACGKSALARQRSGILTLFTARLLTRAGIDQTSCISMGGDVVIGRNPAEYLKEFLADPETRLVAVLGEIGGGKEYEMMDLIAGAKKPVVALMVGRHAPVGRRMGHAGALVESERDSAQAKRAALHEAGAQVADSPFHLVEIVKRLLDNRESGGAVPAARPT